MLPARPVALIESSLVETEITVDQIHDEVLLQFVPIRCEESIFC